MKRSLYSVPIIRVISNVLGILALLACIYMVMFGFSTFVNAENYSSIPPAALDESIIPGLPSSSPPVVDGRAYREQSLEENIIPGLPHTSPPVPDGELRKERGIDRNILPIIPRPLSHPPCRSAES